MLRPLGDKGRTSRAIYLDIFSFCPLKLALMPGSKLEIKLICCSLTVLHNVPLPLDGQALKLIGPQIIKEIHVHCGKLERKNLMLCWQPLLILWCFLQVFFFFCLLALFHILAFSSSSVMHFAHVTVLHTGSNLLVSHASPI